MNSFLLEIGLEEVPASMVQPSIEQLRELVAKTFQQQKKQGTTFVVVCEAGPVSLY